MKIWKQNKWSYIGVVIGSVPGFFLGWQFGVVNFFVCCAVVTLINWLIER